MGNTKAIGSTEFSGGSKRPISKKSKNAMMPTSAKAMHNTDLSSTKDDTTASSDMMLKEGGVIYLLGIKPAAAPKGNNSAQMLIDLVRAGITKRSFDNLTDLIGIPTNELAGIIHISERTLRRYSAETTFPPEQSEHMVELADLYNRGRQVFESIDRFKEWMGRPQLAFGNKEPKYYLDTSIGIRMIMDELGRIEHGIFA